MWINDVVERVHDEEKISFGFKTRSTIIDLNNIICVLRNDDAINNVINIFKVDPPMSNSKKLWIVPMSLMNMLWSL